MIVQILSSFLLPVFAVHATHLPTASHPTRQPSTRSSFSPYNAADEGNLEAIFSLPANNTWFENLAYHAATNTFLATRLDVPQIWSIDPARNKSGSASASGTLLANVSAVGALTGITQLQPSSGKEGKDEFLIAGLNFSTSTGVLQPNSTVFWKLSFQEKKTELSTNLSSSASLFTLHQAFTVPGISLVNGLAIWNESTILAADSLLGAIWRIDVHTGDAVIVSQDPSMTPLTSSGVNGVQVFRPSSSSASSLSSPPPPTSPTITTYIYYTSTDQSLLGRIPVDPITAIPLGPAQVIASDLGEADDFTLVVQEEKEKKNGQRVVAVLLTTGRNNSVVRVAMDGNVVTVAGGEASNDSGSLLAGATSCRFGGGGAGGGANKLRLFVTTAGGAESGGLLEAPGRVVAVDVQVVGRVSSL